MTHSKDDTVVTVIGCGDAFASGGRLQTCFHVQAPGADLLIDCGATAYHGLKQRGVAVSEIDTLVISHFHGDHYGGIPFLLLEEAIRGREQPLTIISPPSGRERITKLLDSLYPGTEVLEKLNLLFKTYPEGGVLQAGQVEISAYPVAHSPETLPHGIRMAIAGKVISYSGDTAWTPMLVELARDADLFLCECNFFESEVKGHMSYKTLLAYDDQLMYRKILLTHFDAEMLDNIHRVSHPCAEDGLQIRLPASY